jgi:hypothetical protein
MMKSVVSRMEGISLGFDRGEDWLNCLNSWEGDACVTWRKFEEDYRKFGCIYSGERLPA